MKVTELNREQLTELKQHYYCNVLENTNASWGDLANIDNLVSDNEIFNFYENTDFVKDDFFSSINNISETDFINIVKENYDILNNLCKRLQDDYNGEKAFEQYEEDRLALYNILESFDRIEK